MKHLKRLLSSPILSFIISHGLLSSLLLGSTIRLAGLGHESFWYDEAFTSLLSSLPLDRAVVAMAGDVHPPAYYIMTWILSHTVGNNELIMRLPACIFGILVIYQTYLLAVSAGYKNQATLCALIVAIMPSQLYYSQEARQYTLLTWLVLFCATSIYKRQWFRSMAAMVVLMYTHNLAFLYVAPLGIWTIVRGKKSIVKYLLLAGLYLPGVVVALRQASDISDGFWIVQHGIGQLAFQLVYITGGFRIPSWLQIHATIIVFGLTLVSLWYLRTDRRLYPIMILSFIPAFLMYAVSALWKPVILERALLPSGALLGVLWTIAIARMTRKQKIVTLAVAGPVAVLLLVSFVLIDRTDFTAIAKDITDHAGSEDAIYHTSIPSAIFLGRYLEGDNYIIPNVGDLNQSLSDQTKEAMGLKQLERPVSDLFEMGYKRLILLRTLTPATNADRWQETLTIINTYKVIDHWYAVDQQFGRFDIFILDLQHHDPRWYRWPQQIARTYHK